MVSFFGVGFFSNLSVFSGASMFMGKFVSVTIFSFVVLGVHLGHLYRVSLFHSTFMLYKICGGVSIMNLVFTLRAWRLVLQLVTSFVRNRGHFWFFNLNPVYQSLVVRLSRLAYQPYVCVSRWIFGLITNFKVVFLYFLGIYSLFLSGFVVPSSYLVVLDVFEGLFVTKRLMKPSFFFCADFGYSLPVVHELGAGGVLGFGLMDSDVFGGDFTLPIPGNDDSLLCVTFFISVLTKFVVLQKLVLLLGFFFYLRRLSMKSLLEAKALYAVLLEGRSVWDRSLLKVFLPSVLCFYTVSSGSELISFSLGERALVGGYSLFESDRFWMS